MAGLILFSVPDLCLLSGRGLSFSFCHALKATTMSDEMSFDSIEMKSIPVTIAGTQYFLQEAGAEAGAFYEDSLIASIRMEDSKPVSVANVKSRDLKLLSMCLYIEIVDDSGTRLRRVKESFVNSLPMRITDKLIDKLKEISGLEDNAETIAGESEEDEDSSE